MTAERGSHPMMCTNGGLWTDDNMKALASDGLSSVIMSIDAHDVAKHEANRGLPDVCRKIKKANEFFHSVGIQTTASITASRLIEDYEKLVTREPRTTTAALPAAERTYVADAR